MPGHELDAAVATGVGGAEERQRDDRHAQTAIVPSETSVSIVAVPWRRFATAAR